MTIANGGAGRPARTDGATPDLALTQDFRRAVAAVRDSLVRNEPEAARAFDG
ncbi:hypothetical protein N8I84_33125 [Streptomyces cynarae]|uniref:Uncharacterized protein n=1 Tax=Streptomyces cynarae TaxID=2981134 RepID=A0ABY6E8H8_9ACTN|nr:hypothetical protein [Streptomyces cynarae]UXY23005.1 hypothetical protein N8I84_33125 [Streptomyces cynarae]